MRKFDKRPYPQMYYKGKLEYVHRVIYMQHTGETLTADDIIHHKDENPFNRDISNLEKLTGDARRRHLEIHRPNFRRNGTARLVGDDCPF
jgi:hypothetical protein